MAVLDANLSVLFSVADQSLCYVTTFYVQNTNDTLYYIDDLTICNRYTVCGFDDEQMLAAERGCYWRNELQLIGKDAGIGYAHVFEPPPVFLAATQFVGMRGGVPSTYIGASYELYAGTPIYKPSVFPTSRVTVGFQVTAQL
ncbi:hypothetical protein A9R05_22920 [Burkholderia sp. KK1]|nr:hypothetical protein A9R05_22920 [Burkholderia sp. KK1]